MQIVIEIPDGYDVTMIQNGSIASKKVLNAVKNGIPPKTGHWIAQDIHNCHTNYKCSECGYIHNFMHLYGKPTADYTYCPSCGAKMAESEG